MSGLTRGPQSFTIHAKKVDKLLSVVSREIKKTRLFVRTSLMHTENVQEIFLPREEKTAKKEEKVGVSGESG